MPILDVRLVERVEDALDEIRPALEMDGGSVEILDITAENIVRLNMVGSCTGCPMSMMTVKMGIERLLRERVPEITGVEAEGAVEADWG